MRAILVSVDYADLLAVTLKRNRHHFEDVCIVTSAEPRDTETIRIAVNHGCKIYETDAFYRNGAVFNKWLALEEGLDQFGRHGGSDRLLCIMDADVIWPKQIDHPAYEHGKLYTPFRRMMDPVTLPIPLESDWHRYPLHRQQQEFAGFTQIFHADDPHLGPPPWHETDWLHAGGADSFFQQKWPETHKVRPGWEVLHLGPAGTNWCGRASPYLDGSRHPDSRERVGRLRAYVRGRVSGPDRFAGEKLPRPVAQAVGVPTGDSEASR